MTIAWMPPLFANGPFDLDRWNAVVALAGQPIPLADSGASAIFTLSAAPAGDAWVALVRSADAGSNLLVHIRDFPFRALFNIDLGVADVAGLPDGLRQAMIEGMFASAGVLVAPGLAVEAQGLPAAFPQFSGSTVQWFAVRLTRPDGQVIELDVGCERAVAARILGNVVRQDAPAGFMLGQQITMPADVTIGSLVLDYSELMALEPGAVVVLAQRPADLLSVRAGTTLYDFTQTDNGWRCAGPRPIERAGARARLHGALGGHSMDNEINAAEAANPGGEAAPVAVPDLRVAVDFDIGRSQVPLGVLSQWQEGMVVDFDPPVMGDGLEVTIRANGDVIGSGDIVRIDDRLAIRITRLLLRS